MNSVEVQPQGNSVECMAHGNSVDVNVFDVRTKTFFLHPFSILEEHVEVEADEL